MTQHNTKKWWNILQNSLVFGNINAIILPFHPLKTTKKILKLGMIYKEILNIMSTWKQKIIYFEIIIERKYNELDQFYRSKNNFFISKLSSHQYLGTNQIFNDFYRLINFHSNCAILFTFSIPTSILRY